MRNLQNKTLLITGATRGIGLAIAKRAAQDGANIVVLGKTQLANDKLPGTVFTAADEIIAVGGKALAVPCDIRFEEQIVNAVSAAVATFGGIDIVVNNASAIDIRNIEKLETKKLDLMNQVNVRGSYLTAKHCIEHLKKSTNPHILTLSPPLDMNPKWFSPMLGYSIAKYGMSLVTLGLSKELANYNIAVNSLWPETAIATAAVGNLLGGDAIIQRSRTPEIVADAAYAIFNQDSATCTGNFFIDVNVLKDNDVTDFEKYSVNPANDLVLDFFLDTPISHNVKGTFI